MHRHGASFVGLILAFSSNIFALSPGAIKPSDEAREPREAPKARESPDARGDAAAPAARVQRITETRSRAVDVKEGPVSFAAMLSRLEVELLVTGESVRGTFEVTDIELTEAVDDAGQDLRPKDPFRDMLAQTNERLLESMRKTIGDGRLEDVRRAIEAAEATHARETPEVRAFVSKSGKGDAEVSLHLGTTTRKATAIKRLAGTMTLLAADAEKRTVTVEKPASRAGATPADAAELDDAALKDAGMRVRLLTVSPDEAVAAERAGERFATVADGLLAIQLEGNTNDLGEIRVLDADGESVGSTLPSPEQLKSSGGRVLILLEQPLTDSVKVEIDLHKGQRRVVVPFEFEGVTLP